MNNLNLIELQDILGYQFNDKKLLIEAITHSTYAYELNNKEFKDNERLEFLGDSILSMITAEYLFAIYPNKEEGYLTQKRSGMVNKKNLAMVARKLKLNKFILLGKGEYQMGGNNNDTNLSGAVEALISAIYLDGGYAAAKQFIIDKIIL